MERALTYITLDVGKIDSGQLIKAKRGDSARRLVVSLTNRGRPYIPGEGVTAVFYERKPDGNPCFNEAQIDGCTVTYDFTGQTTNVVGLAACEIRLYDAENHLLTSPRFELLVEDTEYQEGDVPDSSPEYTALTEMVSKGTELIRDLENIKDGLEPIRDATVEAAERAETAAADADAAARAAQTSAGTAAASATSAKSYSVTAAQEADAAAGSAQLALQSELAAETAADSAVTSADDAQTHAQTAGNYAEIARDAAEQSTGAVADHNVARHAHEDIRLELQALADRVALALNSSDADLDQLAEIVAYIKSNKSLIDAVTTAKVSVADIVDNLATNVSNRPLSAAMGVELAARLRELKTELDGIGQTGGALSAVGDGDDIIITTSLAVRADGDDIIFGG